MGTPWGKRTAILRTAEAITHEIKNACDIIDVVSQYVTLKRSGKNLKGLCPFHREKTPSFVVHQAEQYFKCFGCGAGGDVFKFMQLCHSVSFSEARQMLADRAGIRVEHAPRGGTGTPRTEILRANRWAARLFAEQLKDAANRHVLDYLESRHINRELAERFEVGFAPDSFDFLIACARRSSVAEKLLLDAGLIKPRDTGGSYDAFRNRLMFPIVDPSGQILGFGGRTLGQDSAKYINTPETSVFSKGRCLYGVHMSREAFAEKGRAILVEGYTDVVMAHQHGFAETTAALGTSMTDAQADMLRRYVPRAILVFDADEAGMKAAERGLEIAVRSGLDIALAQIPEGGDPCSFLADNGADAFDALLNSAPSALEFKWKKTLSQHRMGESSAARRMAVEEFLSFIGTSLAFGQCDPIQRGLVVNQLTELLGISRAETNALISNARDKAKDHFPDATGAQHSALAQGGTVAPSGRPHSAEEAATRELLTIILCAPALYGDAAAALDAELVADGQDQRIIRAAHQLNADTGEFSTAQLLTRFEDPDDASRVVEIIELGRLAGNFEERLQAVLGRLNELDCARRSSRAGREAVTGDDQRQRKLAELHQHALEYANQPENFAGVGKIKARPLVTKEE